MDITWVSQLQVGFCNAVLASIWDVSASLRCTIIVCGTHFTQGQSPSSCYLCCAVFCFLFFCVCVLVCVRMLVCIKETRQLSTIQLPNFLRRLKWKVQILVTSFTSTRFACVLRQQCFLSSLQSFQGSGSLPWLGTCALKPTQSSNGRRKKIFSSLLQGSRDAVPFVLHLLPLRLPHQQCNKCAPLFFASPA